MDLDLYQKVKEFVIESFAKNGKKDFEHFERTVYWVKQLKPEADEALLIAAFAHDIERAFIPKELYYKELNKRFEAGESLKYHQEKGAEIIAGFLKEQNADKKIIEKVKSLISKHEVGGDDEQNILKDADSLSFFDHNVHNYIVKYPAISGKDAVKIKVERMFDRITSPKAKEIAKPWYQDALQKLELQK